jgi:hypothetical protein
LKYKLENNDVWVVFFYVIKMGKKYKFREKLQECSDRQKQEFKKQQPRHFSQTPIRRAKGSI